MRPARTSQRGLSIVELMIGLLLGLLLLGGVLHIYFSSNQTYRTTEALSRVQESGRFAMDFLAADIRPAGYKGTCSHDTELIYHLNEGGAGYTDEKFGLDESINGWDGGNGGYELTGYRAGTDVILLKHAAFRAGLTASDIQIPSSAETINLTSASGIPAGQIVLVSDSEGCDIFQNTVDHANQLGRGTGGGLEPGNRTSSPLSHEYSDEMDIHLFRSAIYYVGDGEGNLPALRRMRFDQGNAVDEELVEGILDLQICYGVDTTRDGNADDYVDAGAVADWDEVVSTRVTLVTISPEANVATEAPTISFENCDGNVNDYGASDYAELGERRLAHAFTSTIALRNRLP